MESEDRANPKTIAYLTKRIGSAVPNDLSAKQAGRQINGSRWDDAELRKMKELASRRKAIAALVAKGLAVGWTYQVGTQVCVVNVIDVEAGKLLYRIKQYDGSLSQNYMHERPQLIVFDTCQPPVGEYVPTQSNAREHLKKAKADFTSVREKKHCQSCQAEFRRGEYPQMKDSQWAGILHCKDCARRAAARVPFVKLQKDYCFRCGGPQQVDPKKPDVACEKCQEEKNNTFGS